MSHAPEAFEWPPAPERPARQAFEFKSDVARPTQDPFEMATSAAAASWGTLGPPERSADAPQPEKQAYADLGRLLTERVSAAKQSWPDLSARLVPIALATVSLVALLEGAYILRILTPPATLATANARAPQPRSQLPGAVAPEVAAGPGSMNAADVNGAKPASGTGRLVVRSDPSGAQVLLDGRFAGVTPVTLGNVRAGEHRIVLKRNATELQQTVRVEPGTTTSFVAPMQRSTPAAFGRLAISSPVELDVFENGALLGTSRRGEILLAPGAHTLEVVNANLAYRQTLEVSLETGRTERILVALPQGAMDLDASPWAEVWIDGNSVGKTPIANLPVAIGTHQVVFRHPELGEKTMSTTVTAGVLTRLSTNLK